MKMKHTVIYIGLIIFLSGCGQKSELIKNYWIVIDGTYKGRPIEFHSTDMLKFSDKDGNEICGLNFSKDETIILPGINTRNISAKWRIEDGKIKFTLDSIRYPTHNIKHSDLSFLDTSDSVSEKGKIEKELEINPLTTKEFKMAMEIYGQSFEYYISFDTLVLRGQNGKIRAVRDRTIEDMFRKLQ